ncbi:hypothetical protein HAZT_HAZT001722 [Hyalella azteca]|uniref:Uncharacterized protein n=1 Tax=Hyalella azteca TaxID=294128 RepID=A0A6A0GTL1_HYAAZ|nr:hypothetical protein HAZT_HAZT001722 [Hyalella azteca]
MLYTNSSCWGAGEDQEPERVLLLQERLAGVFERIKTGYLHEARLLASLLPLCLLDLLPPSQVLNKVIMEFISPHQPHPHLLAITLFQVFEACMEESGEALVQEWVLMSLGNFTRRQPACLAVWFITCFLVAASRDTRLRSLFPNVLAWPAQIQRVGLYAGGGLMVQSGDQEIPVTSSRLDRSTGHSVVPVAQLHPPELDAAQLLPPELGVAQLEVFCLAAVQFDVALPSHHHRVKFREVFADVAVEGSPFLLMLRFLDDKTGALP